MAGVEEATTPSDRTVHVEMDLYDWGASGPWHIVYEVAISHGFEVAATALGTWLAATYGPTQGVLDELEDANKVALRHLKKYHKAR